MIWLLQVVAVVFFCLPDATGQPPAGLDFDFRHDTFSYENELRWEYRWDSVGTMHSKRREPPPTYSLRCAPMSRAARQFAYHGRFEPGEPKASLAAYRHWVGRVMKRDSRQPSRDADRVVIPGYADLREFSRDHEGLLKQLSGGAWRSYCQRGNWRMLFPFSRGHQERTAARLVEALRGNRLPLVHLVCFPSLALNHTVLLFEASETENGIEFAAYDPNNADEPLTLLFDRGTRDFAFPETLYFRGGRVNVYEIYRSWCY